MIKHLSFLLFLAIAAIGATAQSVGNWNIMPVYGGRADAIIDAGGKLYCLTSNNLFSLDKQTEEMRHHSSLNGLNDVKIERMAYNADKGYLVLVYNSSNIDLLYDNGRVMNIPDIRDANISSTKTINSIEFTPEGLIYMATDFGFVVIDGATGRVADSGIYNEKCSYAGEMHGMIVLVKDTGVYISEKDRRHNSFDSFRQIDSLNFTPQCAHGLGANYILSVSTAGEQFCVNVLIDVPTTKITKVAGKEDILMDFTRGDNGNMYAASGTVLREFNAADGTWTSTALPAFFRGKTLGMTRGLEGNVWASGADGIGEYSVSNGEITTLRNPSRPEALTCDWPALMYVSPDGNRVYITNIGYDQYRMQRNSQFDFEVKQKTNIIENGEIRDVSCYNFNGAQISGGTEYIVQDPSDPSRYFIANWQKGIFVLSAEDGSFIDHIDGTKLPFHSGWAERCRHITFDRYGNFWLSLRDNSTDHAPLYILPAEKIRDTKTIKPTDWLQPDVKSYHQGDGSVLLHHSRSNYVLISSNHECKGLLVYDHKGAPTQLAQAEVQLFNNVVDQDGIEIKVNYVQCIEEDRNGQIWIGTATSTFVIPDITKAVSGGQLHVRRPKVPRNDGTNYADYLLNGQTVLDIAIDPSNRKWIATTNSGVYLVSADGTEIIENYTMDNSSLPDNKVLSVECDPKGNTVYVGTAKGVASYSSTSSPSAEDYSEVYAYPNPVRPDYTGWITIAGLMDNSLVKITDTAGNLVHQGTSEGGMYIWDGCNTSNQRVRSGVYYVFASQNASGSASGKPVTKIMVIN